MPSFVPSGNVACLLVTHLPVKAERQRYPALRGRPMVIAVRTGLTHVVFSSSPEAHGVEAGMRLGEALARCPGAAVLPADEEYYEDVFGRMADRLEARCPAMERGELGCLYACYDDLTTVYGGEARLIASLLQVAPADFEATVGVAPGRFAARVAAATTAGGRARKVTGSAAHFLSDCPVDLLPISREGKARLRDWGVRSLGHLAAMPPGLVQARLGSEGRYAWELACGLEPSRMEEASLSAA